MFLPLWIVVAALAGILLATLGVGTAVNALIARWHHSRSIAKDSSGKTWTKFLTGNIAAIISAAFVFYCAFGFALAGRTLIGVVDLPGGGPPAPSFGGGGPPAWYLLLSLLAAFVAAGLTDVLVFLQLYRRH